MRGRSRVVGLVLAVLAAAGGLGGLAGASQAGPSLGDAQAQAAALAREVGVLQGRAEQATESYDLVQARLGQLVTEHLVAEQALAAARATVAVSEGTQLDGLRALYESGGPLALYGSLLDGGTLTDFADRALVVSRLVSGQEFVTRGEAVAADRVAALTAKLGPLAAAQTRLEEQVAAAAATVEANLATQQGLLAAANAEVRQIAAQDAASAAAADAAAFAAALAAARGGFSGATEAPPGSLAAAALAAIRTQVGAPYQWGATGPGSFDCSGLTGYAYAVAGVSMPRTAAQQYFAGVHPALAAIQPGDLLFWATDPADPASIDHVGMYAGGDLMYSADHPGDVVRLQPVWWSGFAGITRVVPAIAAAVPGPRWTPGG
ncbi:MAG: C40 family peptidase [Mycobacteriales bacterium]